MIYILIVIQRQKHQVNSIDQYYSKAFSWIETHYTFENTQDKLFFMHLALQFTESIIADYETENYEYFDETYGDSFLNLENHTVICGLLIHNLV